MTSGCGYRATQDVRDPLGDLGIQDVVDLEVPADYIAMTQKVLLQFTRDYFLVLLHN